MRKPAIVKIGLGPVLSVCIVTAAMALGVYGAIGDKYGVLSKEGGPLGPPLTDEAGAPHGGRFSAFKNGYIYWHPQIGAFAVWGAIGIKWDQLGRVSYGYPVAQLGAQISGG